MQQTNQHLDAVMKARSAYIMAKRTLEAKLREQLNHEISNLQTQVDIAVRYAHNSGASKSSILRAMGTKDFYTLQHCLDRTQAVTEVIGTDPLDATYSLDGNVLTVHYLNHGPVTIGGTASFDVKKMDDGTTWFMARDPLWTDDYTVRNHVVAALDGQQDGYYYTEAMAWLDGKL